MKQIGKVYEIPNISTQRPNETRGQLVRLLSNLGYDVNSCYMMGNFRGYVLERTENNVRTVGQILDNGVMTLGSPKLEDFLERLNPQDLDPRTREATQ